MSTVLPREEAVETIFSKILASPEASGRLSGVFYDHIDDDHRLTDNDRDHFLQVLFHAYQNGDISALLLELCGRSMFDLLREAYLIPKKFHGKAGENPVLLTDAAGELLPGEKVSAREYAKFKETYEHHECAPRSALYLADGYDLVRTYTEGLNITEEKDNRKRGVLALYALPDTCKLGLTEAQAAGMTSIYTAGSVIAVIFWAVMMGKLQWNPLKVVLIDSVFTAVALGIVLLVSNVAVIYVAIALLGFFAAGGALQTGLGVRQEMCPGPKGRNTGIYYTWMGLASCFLPYIVSAMTKSIGEASAVYTMMGLLLAAAVIAILMMAYLAVQYKKIFGKSALSK